MTTYNDEEGCDGLCQVFAARHDRMKQPVGRGCVNPRRRLTRRILILSGYCYCTMGGESGRTPHAEGQPFHRDNGDGRMWWSDCFRCTSVNLCKLIHLPLMTEDEPVDICDFCWVIAVTVQRVTCRRMSAADLEWVDIKYGDAQSRETFSEIVI